MHRCSPTPRAFRALLLLAALAAMLFGSSGSAEGQYVSTLHKDYQVVYDDGSSAWTGSGPIVMTGVVINNYWDMLYYSHDPDSPNFSSSPQWQVFFQATEDAKIDDDDFGGTAMYMRRFTPPAWGWPLETDLFAEGYSPTWAQEMERLNYPLGIEQPPLQRGDLIKVEAKAPGMFFGGKMNINTQHYGPASPDLAYPHDPQYPYDSSINYEDKVFSITILERGVSLVAPLITLADLKDESDEFIFAQDRETGCEHYQASLVRLENLYLQEPEDGVEWGDYWSLYNTVTVLQFDTLQRERTFEMRLGLDPDLVAGFDPQELHEKGFHVTAIMNQESGGGGPHTEGYQLWLTNAMDLTVVPEPGTAMLVAFGAIACLLLPRRRRWR